MTTIELLEDRVTELENKVFSLGLVPKIDDPLPDASVVDSLLHAHTLVSSALSGRTKINTALQRLPELNSYLDPNYYTPDLQINAKVELILTLEPELRENARLLSKLEELLPVLESDRFRNVPEMVNVLSGLNVSYAELMDQSKDLNAQIADIFTKYNNIVNTISRALIIMDSAVRAAENAARPVKEID